MKKRRLRKLMFVVVSAILISCCSFLFYYFFESGNVYSQISINASTGGEFMQNTIYDAESFKAFRNCVSNATLVKNTNTAFLKKPRLYITTHTQGNNPIEYNIYIESIIKREAYIHNTKTGKLYFVKPDDFTKLFSCAEFASVYTNQTPPEAAFITLGEQEASVAVYGKIKNLDWNYAKADATYTEIKEDNSISNEYALIKNESDPLRLYFADKPDYVYIKVYNGGKIIKEFESDGTDIYNPVLDGYYTYEVNAKWEPTLEKDFYGEAVYYFNIKFDMPAEIVLENSTVGQGEVLRVIAKNINEEDMIGIGSDDFEIDEGFFKINNGFTALLPVSCTAETGDYNISISINDKTTNLPFYIKETAFEKGTLSISTQIKSSGLKEQEKYLKPLREHISDTLYLTGPFLEPVQGKITTSFGLSRYTNNNPVPSIHNGIDIAAKGNPDILATQTGCVVLAMKMEITGNTVVIDHGLNILSYYYHLDSIGVEKGNIVTAGQVIGKMGTTGYSTGDHLHFTVMLNGIPVNPASFYNIDYSNIES